MAVNERMVEYKVLALACLKSLDFCVVLIISKIRASLVAQWLRIRLSMQGTLVRAGFGPWSGKIPHALEQISPCATTTEPAF